MMPFYVRELAGLQDVSWNRRLLRRERRRLEALELLCRGPLKSRHWLGLTIPRDASVPGDALQIAWLKCRPDLPKGRLGVIVRIARVRQVLEARSALASLLVRRIRQQAPPLRPMPEHGRKCPVGCADCAAIARWRREYALLSGVDAHSRNGYLFP